MISESAPTTHRPHKEQKLATSIITGRDISITIDSKVYDPQVLSTTLTTTLDRQAYETIDGRVFKAIDSDATIEIEMLADWGASSGGSDSFCEIMWGKADSAPNTALNYTFVAATGASFAGQLYPSFPAAGGSGKDAQTVTFTLQCTAKPTLTIS